MIHPNRKLLFALVGVFLMTSGIFTLVAYIPAGTIGTPQSSPALSNVGETALSSVGVNYWTNGAVANSGTTTIDLPVAENSSYSNIAFDNSASWTEISFTIGQDGKWTITENFPSYYFYTDSNSNIIQINDVVFALAVLETSKGTYFASLGAVYANLSFDGSSIPWSYSPQFNSGVITSQDYYGFIDPQWNIYNLAPADTWYGTTSVTFTYLSVYGDGSAVVDSPVGITSTNGYQGQNTIIQNPSVSTDVSVPFAIGYHFNSVSTSFTIPKYESSFDLTWSSSSSTNPQYNGQSPSSTSGTLTGSLGSNSFTVYPVGDPAGIGMVQIPFSYYLSSQYQVSTAQTIQTASPTYTYTQVSGTTNEASASFGFSGSTPSTAVFIPYESATNSLATDNTNIQFTPSATIQNPYSSYTQNQLTASMTGASTGSYSGSNAASPSFSGNAVSYTVSTAPSWTVNLNLYGNVAPTISTPSTSFASSGSEVSVTFTSSQNVFNGELQTYLINWGDGNTNTYSDLATGTYTETHTYSGTFQGTFSQTYTIYVEDTNVPNPASNGLSGLTTNSATTTYTIGMTDTPTTPDSILKVGQSIYMNITATNLIISGATVSVNGLSPVSASLIKQSGSTYDFKYSSSLFGVSGVTVTWSIDPAGIVDIFSTQYATPIEPTQNSSYVTALFSNSATHSYQITLSGVSYFTIPYTLDVASNYYLPQFQPFNVLTGSNINGTVMWYNNSGASRIVNNINSGSGISGLESILNLQSSGSYWVNFSSIYLNGNGAFVIQNSGGTNQFVMYTAGTSSYLDFNVNFLTDTWSVQSGFASNRFPDGMSGTWSGNSTMILVMQGELGYVANFTLPTLNGQTLTTSQNNINNYPLLTSSPYYQQLITISNPASYGINLVSGSAGSNIQFTAQNGSLLYAWIQSINSTSMQVWVKNYYGSSTIDMQVLPEFENLFSATGYLGEAPQLSSTYGEYFNAYLVFPEAKDFQSYSEFGSPNLIDNGTGSVIMNNGMQTVQGYNNTGTSMGVTLPYYATSRMVLYVYIANYQLTGGSANRNSNPQGFGWSQYGATYYARYGAPIAGNPSYRINEFGAGVFSISYNIIGGTSQSIIGLNSIYFNATNYVITTTPQGYVDYEVSPSTTVNQTTPAYAEIGEWNNAYNTTMTVYYAFIATPPNQNDNMPTYTIGTGSVFQANATADNTTSQPFWSFTSDGSNLTNGIYTYHIPDSFNSNYITIYYNPAWTVDFASYGFSPGLQAMSSGSTMPYITFAGVSGIGTLSVTFIEPLVIGQPLGTMSLGVLPSVAVDGNAFFELPNDLLNWKANSVPVNPSGFSVVVGKPIQITAYSAAGDVSVYNKSFTPTKQITFLQTYVNVSEFQFNNLNSTDEVSITATASNGNVQSIALVAPYGTGASSQTVYLPSGSYTFKYTELNYTTGHVIPGTSTATAPLADYNGEYWVTLSGITIYQLGNQLTYTNSSIQKSIQTLSIIISLNDSQIKNLSLAINANLSITNSSIKNYMTEVLVNESTIHSEVQNYSTNIQLTDNLINTTVHLVSTNVTLFQNYVKTYLNTTENNIKLQENFLNTTLNTVYNNLTLFQTYVKTTINDTINNVKALDVVINSTLSKVNNNVTLDEQFVNDTIHTVSNNLTLFNNYVHTTINATINNINSITTIVNSTVHDVSTNITLFNNYVHDTINATITDIHDENIIINSTVHTVENNLTLFNTYVHDTINTTLTDVNLRDQYMNDTVGVISNNVSLLQTYTKDVIHSEMNNLSVVSTYINDTMGNMNISFNSKVSILNTTMNNVNLNATTYFQIEHDIMNNIKANQTDIYKATELSGAYSYKLVPENVVAVSGGIEMQLWVENHDGTVVNSSQLVHYLFENMSAEIMSLNGQGGVPPKLISYTAHYMTVEFPLTSQEISSLESGANDTMIQVFSPFYTGGVADIATGSILPSSFPAQQLTWYEQYLGFKSPPPGGFMPDVWWIILSIPGFLSVGILGALVSIYYLLKIRSDLRDGQKKKEEEAKKEEDRRMLKEIHKKVTEND